MAAQTINQSPQVTDFTVLAGDTLQFGFRIRDVDTGQLVPLTGKTIHCQVRTKQGVLKQDLTEGDGITITTSPEWNTAQDGAQDPVPPVADEDVTDGMAVLLIEAATTADIATCRELKYDIEVTEPDGQVRTHRIGRITGQTGVTRI
jgi:hypothetical protein